MIYNPVSWFEIYVDDLARAMKFYRTVFNTQLDQLPGGTEDFTMVTFPWKEDSPNISGALVKAKGMKAGGNSTVLYFHSTDCQKEEDRVETAGGKIIKPKFSVGKNGYCCICTDTEGNTFGIYSNK